MDNEFDSPTGVMGDETLRELTERIRHQTPAEVVIEMEAEPEILALPVEPGPPDRRPASGLGVWAGPILLLVAVSLALLGAQQLVPLLAFLRAHATPTVAALPAAAPAAIAAPARAAIAAPAPAIAAPAPAPAPAAPAVANHAKRHHHHHHHGGHR